MASPVTPILDTFNRADGAPGANWTAINTTNGLFSIVSNQAKGPATGDNDGGWNPTVFGRDQEVFCDVLTGGAVQIWVRINTLGGTTPNGYFGAVDGGLARTSVWRSDNGVVTQLGGYDSFAGTISQLWLTAVGPTISVYVNTGSGYVLNSTRTDATYSAGGNIGMTLRIPQIADNFGGGDLPGPLILHQSIPFIPRGKAA